MGDRQETNGIVKFIIFVIILGGLAYGLFMFFSDKSTKSEIEKANTNAQKVYTSVSSWLSGYKPKPSVYKAPDKKLIFHSDYVSAKSSSESDDNNKIFMDLSHDLPENFSGDWVIIINSGDMSVDYILWSDKKIEKDSIKPYTSFNEQKDYFKKNESYIGYYKK